MNNKKVIKTTFPELRLLIKEMIEQRFKTLTIEEELISVGDNSKKYEESEVDEGMERNIASGRGVNSKPSNYPKTFRRAAIAEDNVPNTDSKKAITVKGDPIKDVKLNAMVKNPSIVKKPVPHVNSKNHAAKK